jgi:zinc protease
MTRWWLALFVLFALPARAAVEVQEVYSDEAGIYAWLVEEHAIPLVAMEVSFRGGAALDPAGREGLANMVSGLLDEGAATYDSLAFQTRLEDLAIRMGFAASRDRFSGSLKTLSQNAGEAFRLFGLALSKPRFDAEPVERVRQQIITGLIRQSESPRAIARRAWFKSAFPDHPYGRPVDGTQASVKAITAADLRGFARRRLAQDNMVIAVVGDITPTQLARLLDVAFGGLPEAAAPAVIAKTAPRPTPALEVIRKPVPQSTMVFGHGGLLRDDPDWYAAYVLNYILGGGGFASRLTEEVREKRGLAYSVYSYLSPLENAGLFLGGVATKNAQAGETIRLIEAVIARLRNQGASAQELKNAKTYLTGSYPLNFNTSGKIAAQLTAIQIHGLGLDYITRRNSYIEAVTLDQVRRVAKRLLAPDHLRWTVVGKPEGLDAKETPDAQPALSPAD